jgi:hypothetical protein
MPSEENFTSRPPEGASGVTPGYSASLPPAGLPPVAPPSGKLMLQLFLVPGLIVAFLVAAWLIGGWLFGVSYSKEQFLSELDDPNTQVRWRAWEQLSQVLPRDDKLASDGDFARQLGLLLEKKRDLSRPAEKAYVDFLTLLDKEGLDDARRKEKAEAEQRKLEPDRDSITFLSASLGGFMVPVGAPILKELALPQEGMDAKASARQRRRAVWTLAVLGDNLKRFDKLTNPQKPAVLERLRVALWDTAGTGGSREDFLKLSADEKDAALDKLEIRPKAQHADWLRDALLALRKRTRGENDDMGVGDVLITCSSDKDDPFLRKLSALAMNSWRGDERANARMEEALTALIHDDGAGEEKLADLEDGADDSPFETATRIPGLEVRFNAAVALARFGAKQPPVDVLKDMLDESYLRSNLLLRPRQHDGPEKVDEGAVGQTLINALKAVAELHRLRPDADLSSMAPSVDSLTGSSNADVRTEAEKTRNALKNSN